MQFLGQMFFSSAMAVTRAVLITLVLVLITSGASYPNTVEQRESTENEAIDAKDEV